MCDKDELEYRYADSEDGEYLAVAEFGESHFATLRIGTTSVGGLGFCR